MAPDQLDEGDPGARKLADLEERLKKARGPEHVPRKRRVSGLDMAYRLTAELVASVLVGMGLGWGLDFLLGTSPVFLIVLLLFGIVAGIFAVFRTARSMDAGAGGGSARGNE
jgi:ATP synthase protein I